MTAADKLYEAAKALRDDLLMRAEMNAWQHDGEVVVDCGNGVWRRINDELAAYEREKAGQERWSWYTPAEREAGNNVEHEDPKPFGYRKR